ncbi:MAG: zinc protease [Candidatus Azotimanducaceae bacterium]|jgi:zinc protease
MKTSIKISFLILNMIMLSAFAADSRFQLPEYERVELKNGLTLFLMEQHEVPLISINASIKAGAKNDRDQQGIAGLTIDGLKMGINGYSKQALEDLFDFHGASLSADISQDAAIFSLSLAAKDLDILLPVFLEMLQKPLFPEQDTSKMMDLHLQKLEQSLERPKQIVHRYFYKALFGNHPYGNPVEGNKQSIENISAADLKNFHGQYYQPDQIAISLAGDFDAKKMKRKLSKLIKNWKSQSSNKANVENMLKGKTKISARGRATSLKEDSRIIVVNKDDARETNIRIGGLGIPRSNPDYVELKVLNTILGGRFTSWLMSSLRTDAGLTYGAGSYFRPLEEEGAFYISTFTNKDTTFETIDLTLKTYQRMLDGEIDQEILSSAKNYVVGLFPPKFEKTSDLSAFLGDMFIYDFDESYVNTFEEKVANLSLSRAKELAEKYFPNDNLVFVLIGREKLITEEAKKYGTVFSIDITDPLPLNFETNR